MLHKQLHIVAAHLVVLCVAAWICAWLCVHTVGGLELPNLAVSRGSSTGRVNWWCVFCCRFAAALAVLHVLYNAASEADVVHYMQVQAHGSAAAAS
jgi:hypothetical protein